MNFSSYKLLNVNSATLSLFALRLRGHYLAKRSINRCSLERGN